MNSAPIPFIPYGRQTITDMDIAAVESKVIEWRRDFHQHPELSNREFKTAMNNVNDGYILKQIIK